MAKYSDPYLEFVLCISPIQVYTHSSHDAVPGSSWGFGALLKGISVVVLRVERERWTFPPPTDNPCWILDSNPRPLVYKPNSNH